MEHIIPVLVFLSVLSAAHALFQFGGRSGRLASRLDGLTGAARPQVEEPADAAEPAEFRLLREQKYSNWALLDQMIAQRSWAEREAAELTRANVPLRVGEFLLLRVVLAGGAVLIAAIVTQSAIIAPLFALPAYMAPRLWIKHLQAKRKKAFEGQLVDAVQLLASTLKSGYSFLQGMEAISREMPAPMSEEFDLLVKEIGVGARADEALLRLIERVQSQDLELVVTAIMIQRTVGGELAGILENIARTVRERQKIMRDVQTLTAQQRWSGYIIGALPVFLLAVISLVNPGYTGELFYTLHGQVMLAVAMVFEVAGFIMIQRIVAIDV